MSKAVLLRRKSVRLWNGLMSLPKYSGTHGVVSSQIKVPHTRWGYEHQGCLYWFAGTDGHVGRDDRRILKQEEAPTLVIACVEKVPRAARPTSPR
jgi:hypothetical protein